LICSVGVLTVAFNERILTVSKWTAVYFLCYRCFDYWPENRHV